MSVDRSVQTCHTGTFAKEAKEIKNLHDCISTQAKKMIKDAIRIGELLLKVKDKNNDNFDLWVVKETGILSLRTAYRYIAVYNYQNQLDNAGNLNEAYKLIETFEAQKKQSESQKAYQRVAEYKKTGIKPEGWRRGTDDKLAQEDVERDARIEAAKQESNKKQEERKQRDKSDQENWDFIHETAKQQAELLNKRIDFKQKIRISAQGTDEPYMDALMDFLESLEDDNRRIEACYNIIKICKRIAVELQGNKP